MRNSIAVIAIVWMAGLGATTAFAGLPEIDPGSIVGDCGTTSPEPGCSDAICEECVCDFDSFCCSDEWTFGCVLEAAGQAKKKKAKKGGFGSSCQAVCLVSARSAAAPTLSIPALATAILGLVAMGGLATRRRRSTTKL